MSSRKSFVRLAALSAALLLGGTLAAAAMATQPKPMHENIIETLQQAGNFNTLLEAIDAAGMTGTLSQSGHFTLFAPNDEAFAKLPPGTLENLLKPENKAELVNLLRYHTAMREYRTKAFAKVHGRRHRVKTLDGNYLNVNATPDGAVVNGAKLIKGDILASNGVIHEIDTVLIPPTR